MRYAHRAPEHLRSAVSRLDAVLQDARKEQEVEVVVEKLVSAKS
jgi:hypothetical protein